MLAAAILPSSACHFEAFPVLQSTCRLLAFKLASCKRSDGLRTRFLQRLPPATVICVRSQIPLSGKCPLFASNTCGGVYSFPVITAMADAPLSSDIEQDAPSPRVSSPKSSKNKRAKSYAKAGLSKGKSSKSHSTSSGVDKLAQRRHNVLERQFNKAQCQVQSATTHTLPQPEVDQCSVTQDCHPQETDSMVCSQEDIEYVPQVHPLTCIQGGLPPNTILPPQVPHAVPEATFTPTAAGLRMGEGQSCGQFLDFQSLVSQAITCIFQAGLQQATLPNQQEGTVRAHSAVPLTHLPTLGQVCTHPKEHIQDE